LQTQALVQVLLPVVADDPVVSEVRWLRRNVIVMALRGEDYLGKVLYSARSNSFHVSLSQIGHSRIKMAMDIPINTTSNPAVRTAFHALFRH